MPSEVIILGSANSQGDTRQMVNHIVSKHPMDIIDLKPLNISHFCLLYTSPSPRDATLSRMPSSA